MGKRMVCLLVTVALIAASMCGIRTEATAAERTEQPAGVSASRIAHSTSALVSAMLLVLAGISISLLFDKKES